MAMFSVWMLILIPLTSWNCASGCMWMKPQSKASLSNFQVLSNSSIVHLQQACRVAVLEHGYLSMEFPHKQYNLITQLQAKDHILFISRTLKSVMRLYKRKCKKMDCDQQKLQIFLLNVDRQISELERCATYVVIEKEAHKQMFKEMEVHFRSLVSHLKNTEYNAKSWNDIIGVTLKHLRRLHLLATTTKTDSKLV